MKKPLEAEGPYSRVKHIAMAVFMGRWKDCYMAMFTAYFDASGSPDQGAALSVAGFVAKAEQWIEFERNWNDALRDYGVTDLHMKHFAPGAGQYASWKNDKVKRERFAARLANIIKTRCENSFVNCIMLSDYRKVDEIYQLRERHKPLALAACSCVDKVMHWAKRRNLIDDEIVFQFEDGDKDKGELMRSCERDHGFIPGFMKKKQSVAFQAADLLAWEHRRANKDIYEAGVGVLALQDLRGSLRALYEVPHDDADWGVYDEESLTAFCVGNAYPLRETCEVQNV